MTDRSPARRALSALLALGLGFGAVSCAQEADDSPLTGGGASTTTRPDGGSGGSASPGGEQGGTIEWTRCAGGECAELDVPVDYGDPDGATLTLTITRVPATGNRIGALFLNPGGPGGTASDFATQVAPSLPRELTERFDIVGVDPRGLGASDIDCGGDIAELYSADPTVDTPADERELLELSQDYVDGCDAAAGDLLGHLGTENVARDIDAVRAAMGDDQLSYLGFSYGTAIGQVLLDLFPDRVRAMVLDGVVELGPTGVELAVEQAVGFEGVLDSFVEDCDRRASCPLAPDTAEAIDELTEAVEDEPIPATPRDLGPGELALAMANPLYDESRWPSLARAVADALDGDGTGMVALAEDYLDNTDFDIYFAVNCLDFAWPDSPEALLEEGAAAAEEAPRFGEAIVNDYVRCSMWPAEAEPLPEVTAPDAPPVLVVSTTNDPATPYQAGVDTAERLETGVLLTYEGEGHTALLGRVPCVEEVVVGYLVDLDPPADGTTC